MIEKKSEGGGFSKILRNFESGSSQMIMFAYKVGGWGMPNDYVFLHGGWVGLARWLRNKKRKTKKQTLIILLLNIPEIKNYNIHLIFYSKYII